MKAVDWRKKHGRGFLWFAVWSPLNLIMAFSPLFVLNFLQIPSLLLKPWSPRLFRRYNRRVAYIVWGSWAWCMEHLIGVKLTITGDLPQKSERALVISNHQSMADALLIICYFYKYHDVSWTNWLAKDALRWVPGLGWGLAFFDTVFLKRDWLKDEAHIKGTFAKCVREDADILLVSFPEGTRITEEKRKRCQEYASHNNRPVLQHVLLPRSRGFEAMVLGLGSHVGAIYSLTIVYDQKVPTLLQMIRGEVDHASIHMKRTPISELPPKDQLANWLEQDFVRREDVIKTSHNQRSIYTP